MIQKLRFFILSMICLSGLFVANAAAQQVADMQFNPAIGKPAYPHGHGPVVMVDEAHFNFHTAEGRYLPFARLLRRDGYIVRGSRSLFSKKSLESGRILVIVNALAERNRRNWSLPTPSAFSDKEIDAVRDWVKGGGSLFLVADHMPFPGCAEKLARAFGIQFNNGFAINTTKRGPIVFDRSSGTLINNPVTEGRSIAERIDSVATFTGSAFRIRKGVNVYPLLVFGPHVISLMPKTAWKFSKKTRRVLVKGWYQGAVLKYGKGRVAVFGEAAMFTAQVAGPRRRPMGMNAPIAAQNAQFLLNVMHWLSGLIE